MQRAFRVDKDGQHKFSHYTKIYGDKVIVCAVNESCWFSVNRIVETVRKCRPYECQDGVCLACGSFYEGQFGNGKEYPLDSRNEPCRNCDWNAVRSYQSLASSLKSW